MFIIGEKKKEDYDALGGKMGLDINIKYFSNLEWAKLAKEKNNLCQEIVKNHILIFGTERFIEIIWGKYYGFN